MSLLWGTPKNAVENPPYSISATPAFIAADRGTTVTYAVTVTRNDYVGDLKLQLVGLELIGNVTATFSPSTLSGATLTATLTVVVPSNAQITTSTPLLIEVDGVNAPPAYAPVSLSVLAVPTDPDPDPDPEPVEGFGLGANAPAWANGSNYRQELFATDIPVNSGAAPSGWIGQNGFTGYRPKNREVVYNPGPRVTYPTVSTPIGTKRVFQWIYPGASYTITGAGQTITPWPTDQNTAFNITGTWSGTLAFEISLDQGATWAPVTCRGIGNGAVTGTQTSTNGLWDFMNTISGGYLLEFGNENKLLRIRADAWTSGTATISIGMKGGEVPIRGGLGRIDGKQRYVRFLVRMDADFASATQSEVKGIFLNTAGQRTDGTAYNAIRTAIFYWIARRSSNATFSQLALTINVPKLNGYYTGALGPAHGTWLDVEWLLVMNTLGQADGVFRGWINGQENINVTTVRWVPADVDGVFAGLLLEPVWGGNKSPPTRTNSIQIAAWYQEATMSR
jgi:hypothetical protein